MLDAAFIRDNLDAVKQNCAYRNVRADIDGVIRLDDERKRLISEAQSLQQRRNEVSAAIPKEKDPAARQALIAEGKSLRERIDTLEKQRKQVEDDQDALLLTIPNM